MAKPKKTEEELAEEERQWDSLEAWAREQEVIDACIECEGGGCDRCDGTGIEPDLKRPSYRLNPS